MNSHVDRPPIARFLWMFAALLAAATGLAALSQAPGTPVEALDAAAEQHTVQVAFDVRAPSTDRAAVRAQNQRPQP
jgi:hypothetical protein